LNVGNFVSENPLLNHPIKVIDNILDKILELESISLPYFYHSIEKNLPNRLSEQTYNLQVLSFLFFDTSKFQFPFYFILFYFILFYDFEKRKII